LQRHGQQCRGGGSSGSSPAGDMTAATKAAVAKEVVDAITAKEATKEAAEKKKVAEEAVKKKAVEEAVARKMVAEEAAVKKKAAKEAAVKKKAAEEVTAKRKVVDEVTTKKKASEEVTKKTESGAVNAGSDPSLALSIGVKRAAASSGSTPTTKRQFHDSWKLRYATRSFICHFLYHICDFNLVSSVYGVPSSDRSPPSGGPNVVGAT
jgi:hypothetical protein